MVIILSDGEEHTANSIDVLKALNDHQLKVYTVGIGSEKGGLIPVFDESGSKRVDYKKDRNGDAIISRLHADTLKSLAALGNGSYYQSTVAGTEINALLQSIATLQRDQTAVTKIGRYRQLYQYFLGVGILLFLVAYLLPDWRMMA